MTRPQTNPTRRLLRLKDGAQYLSLSPGSLRRLIQAGELQVIRLADTGAPWLVDVRDLDGWIERTKTRLE